VTNVSDAQLPDSVEQHSPDNRLRCSRGCACEQREQIQHFFEHYKDLEPRRWVKVVGWGDAAEARKLIVEAIVRAKA